MFDFCATSNIFQSTLPRRERRFLAPSGKLSADISIHAPAKGATALRRPTLSAMCYFNPRSREGSDAGR